MNIKTLFITLVVLCLVLVPLKRAWAESSSDESKKSEDELTKEIEKLEAKLNSLKGKATTLSSEIDYLDGQIALTETRIENSKAKISKTEESISKLSGDIADLGTRIEKLKDAIAYQKEVLNSRFREQYKIGDTPSFLMLLGSNTLDAIINKAKYLEVMEYQDKKLMSEMEEVKTAFNAQKGLFEEKKKEEETLRAQLETEKRNLDASRNTLLNQQNEKAKLLKITQSDEAKYQELLNEAQKELMSYKSFTQSAGGGQISGNGFGKGKKGWYFSQRDSRWANSKIGNSSESILEVGCLLTSVAMVQKSYGIDVDPKDIASDDDNFFASTAMMLIPWPAPAGKSYNAISASSIDSELSKGRPVIVGVYAGPYGTHFIVLAEKKGADYIMYDPWYGPDLEFSDYYTKSSIFQAVVFK